MQRPANLRIIRLMCSGRMGVSYVIQALKAGADGVLIGACHIGDCHYVEGNHKTVRRFAVLPRLLEQIGIDPKRFQLWHISASEGAEFTERIKEYIHELKKLGPNPLKEQAAKKFTLSMPGSLGVEVETEVHTA
jgi:F420-non-reducing hydrogenase iron-sulfur subunit